MKRYLAALALFSSPALADSTTTCTRSPLGTFVNCQTTSDPDYRQTTAGVNALAAAIASRGERKRNEREAARYAALMPKDYDIDETTAIFMDVCGGDFRGGRDTLGQGLCLGYVAGIARRESDAGITCLPKTATAAQILAVATRDIRNSPESWHYHPSALVSASIGYVFRCPAEADTEE